MPSSVARTGTQDLPRRFCALDSLRFIGALIIAVAHFSIFADANWIAEWIGGVYPLVDYFFILSGFVMMSSYHNGLRAWVDYVAFLKNRLARIYPLHFALLVIYLALGVAHWTGFSVAADASKYDPRAIIPNLLLVHAWGTTDALSFNFPSWSISAEWLAYLVFPIAVWIARRGGWPGVLATVVGILCGLEWLQAKGVIHNWPRATYDFGALRAVPGFFAGIALFLFCAQYRPKLKSFLPALLLFAVGVVVMVFRFDPRISMVFAIGVIGMLAAGEIGGAGGVMRHPLLVRLGDASYAIYMIHPLVGTLIVTGIGKRVFHLSGEPLLAWAMLVAVPATLLISPLIYDRFEKPARKALINGKRSKEILTCQNSCTAIEQASGT